MNSQGWVMSYMRVHAFRFAGIIAIGALTLLSAGMLTFTSGFLISKAALRPENILMLYVPIVGVRAFGIGRSVLRYVERLQAHDAVLRVLSKMRVRLYRTLEPQALQLKSRHQTGDLLGMMSDDIESLQNMYVRTIFPGITALIMYGAVVCALGWFDMSFAMLIAVYILILIVIVPIFSLLMTRTFQKRLKSNQSALYRHLTDAVLGLSDLMISGRASEFVNQYEESEREAAVYERKLSRHKRYIGLITQTVIGLIVAQMAIWATSQVGENGMDATLLAAFILVVIPLADAFIPVTDAVQRIPVYQESLQRLTQIEQSTVYPNKEHAQSSQNFTYLASINDFSNDDQFFIEKATRPPAITLKEICYSYHEPNEYAVNNISIEVKSGQKIAIIGRSGAGKSTLLKLIQGAYLPQQGQIYIQGKTIAEWGDQITEQVSVLNQKPYLFDTSLLNNIRLGRPTATEEEVRQVIEQAQLSELIASLPEGDQTPMREAGQRFSGGERQRIALARVLLQDTPIVILDEPTVGLDPRTERELIRTILQSLQGKTLIWVTHHLLEVQQMDHIIFMDQGKIAMQGTHEHLIDSSERYRRLYQLDHPQWRQRTLEKVYT